MLILTRLVGSKLFIGDDIELIILGVQRGQIKIGIKAPANIAILREEARKKFSITRDMEFLEEIEVKNVD